MIIVTDGFSKISFLSFSEAAVCRCSSKQVLLEMSQYSQENINVGVYFNNIALQPATLIQSHLKINSNTIVFLRILSNFYETTFF